MDSKKNLVLGAIKGYSFEQIRPFVVSLKRTAFDGDLVLFCNRVSSETRAALVDHGVKLESFQYRGSSSWNSWSRFWPMIAPVVRKLHGSPMARKMLRYIVPLQTARFFHYHDFLAKHESEYRQALLTDVRDVFFQDDPFSGLQSELMVFEEDSSLRLADEKEFNAPWIEQLFGPAALAQLGRFPILCSGTILGTAAALLRYLAEFEKLLVRAKSIAPAGSDQGVHNYLCRLLIDASVQISKNNFGPVLTMRPTLTGGVDFALSSSGQVLDSNGKVIPVLHQYDRHPELASSLIRTLVD